MFVKMCGMMRREELELCAELGIDAAGIVVEYPRPVPWNLSRATARRLVESAPTGLKLVMVTSGAPEFIAQLAAHVRPHIVQVHGEETLDDVAGIVERLRPMGIKVFRALRIVPETREAAGEVADPCAAACAIAATGVSGIVVDSKVPQRPGGTGVAVDVETIAEIVQAAGVPVIAAGGLKAENVGTVIQRARPWGVDVLTGIEAAPGEKDRQRMQEFVEAVRAAIS